MSFLCCICSIVHADLKAFPSAVGYGAAAAGGRGGRVIIVDNLNASGPGSFREAVEAEGPRIVVFRKGGTIDLGHYSLILKNPYITIAGQTAPGGGITIRGGFVNIATHNVIIRHVRFRPGPGGYSPGQNAVGDGFRISSVPGTVPQTVICDHCSFSWGTDEVFSSVGTGKTLTTIQYSIISEAMDRVPPPYNHPEMSHSKGVLLAQVDNNMTFFSNLLAHNFDRNPQVNAGKIDLINNIIYNYGGPASINPRFSPILANIIGNIFIAGVNSLPGRTSMHEIRLLARCRVPNSETLIECPYLEDTFVHIEDNLGTEKPDSDNIDLRPARVVCVDSTLCLQQSSTRLPLSIPSSLIARSRVAYDGVLTNVGVLVPEQDAVDKRIISDVVHRTGQIINEPEEVGGYPQLQGGSPYPDADNDGMSDLWEAEQLLSNRNAADASEIDPRNKYTNIENFINELAGDAAVPVRRATPTPTRTPTPKNTNTPTATPTKTITPTPTPTIVSSKKAEMKQALITKLCPTKNCAAPVKYFEGDFNGDKGIDLFVAANGRYAAIAFPYIPTKIKSGKLKGDPVSVDKAKGSMKRDRILEKERTKLGFVQWRALNPLTGARTKLALGASKTLKQ